MLNNWDEPGEGMESKDYESDWGQIEKHHECQAKIILKIKTILGEISIII